MTGTARIIQGNALALPLPDASVDLVVTSPPYFGLRSYQDGGQHYEGQIGAEPTPAEFVDALIKATAEMVRVLKPSGSIWVNLGDKYSGAQAQNFGGASRAGDSAKVWAQTNPKNTGVRAKSLMGIPWRYALRCIDDLGLILRAEVIWSKPNGLPESVTDRVRRSHETWLHFTKEPRYFSAVDEIREAHSEWSQKALNNNWTRRTQGKIDPDGNDSINDAGVRLGDRINPLGKLPGSVWTVPTQPLQVPPELGVDHFAAFPMEWPRRIIQGWSPAGVCSACGEGRRPVSDRDRQMLGGNFGHDDAGHGQDGRSGGRAQTVVSITGYACACPDTSAPTIPAVVLDPFGGTGTTALVAKMLSRTGISVDMSADYCRIATWRTNDPGQMAAAAQVEKPDPIHPDQLDLFGDDAA